MLSSRPTEPDTPQYYRVTCAEGHVLRGPRTEGYQALRCPGCGGGLFVLPRSPLPDPPAPAARRQKPVEHEDEAPLDEPIRWVEPASMTDAAPPDDDGIDFFDETIASELESAPEAPAPAARTQPAPEARPEPPRPKPRAKPARPPAAAAPTPAAAPAARPQSPPKPQATRPPAGKILLPPPRRSIRARVWRHRHLLALAGVVLLVTATVAYRSYRSYRENLPRVAEASRTRGLEAFSTGSFDVAKRELARAADALESLRDTRNAPAVRQLAREAALFADLATSSLEEIVEAVATSASDKADTILQQQGRSFLIDSTIEVAPKGDKPAILTDRILVAGKIGRIDLDGLELFRGQALPAGQAVTFGARIDSIVLADDGRWHIRLQPESGVFITSPEAWKALEMVGFPTRDVRLEDLR
jgi:hypothetical protein